VNFELLRARIPVRAGVKSQWHSFLFLNQAIRQKRSLAEKHEFEYNLELVEKTLSVTRPGRLPVFEIKKPEELNILDRYKLEPKKYIVVHPGMMGSALNWPQAEYISYMQKQLDAGKKIVITGTESDEPYLTEIRAKYLNHPKVIWLQSKLNMNELVQILANAEFVVVPSTGVAHLAASVGTPVKAIFSPVRVHHPRRWAPRGPDVEIWMIKI
jgi:ADP-heptose:LPS heptosyltransferase